MNYIVLHLSEFNEWWQRPPHGRAPAACSIYRLGISRHPVYTIVTAPSGLTGLVQEPV